MTLEVIVGVLSGSVFTEIARQVLHHFNRKIEFKKELQKIHYERKLQKAEKAIAYYHAYSETVSQLKKSMEVLIKVINETDYDTEKVEDIIDKSLKFLDQLDDHKYLDVNSIHLYFDLKDDNWNEEDNGMFMMVMSEVTSIKNDYHYWMNLYSNTKNDDQRKFQLDSATELQQDLLASLKKVIELLQKNEHSMNVTITSIKEQTKMY